MCRRLICLTLVLVVSGMMGNAAFGDSYWAGAVSSNWFDADNWNDDYPEETPGVKINIYKEGDFDPIVDGTTTPGLFVDISKNGSLTIDAGGHVQSNNFLFMGRIADGEGDNLLTINEGGKFTGGITNAERGARVGYGQAGMHTIQMNGGEFSVPGPMQVNVNAGSQGHIQLDGGVMNIGGLEIGAEGAIDLNGGTLVIIGDATAVIDGYVAAGKITSANGTTVAVCMDYDVTNAGKTTVTMASVEKASTPYPADGAVDVPVDTLLSWIADSAATQHFVYLLATPADPNAAPAYALSRVELATDVNGVDGVGILVPAELTHDTTYLWAVDLGLDGSQPYDPDTIKGDTWTFTTASLSQDPGTDNLVAYYALDGNTQDSSGQGNHGTAVGGPTYTTGLSGEAMAFDGLTQKVDLGNLDVVGSGLTMAAWIKPESYPDPWPRVMAKATGGGEADNWWMMNIMFGDNADGGAATRLRVRVKPDGKKTSTVQANSGSVMLGEWTHAAATWDGAKIRLYHNLFLVGSKNAWGSAVAVDPTVPAAIGLQPHGNYEGLTGVIDDVRIYNRALSEAELFYIAE